MVEELDNITANVEMVEQEVSSATKLSKAKNTINDESRSVPSTEIDSQLLVESSWEDLLSVPATRLASTKRTVSKGKDKEKSYNQIVSSSKPQKRLFGTTLDPNKQFREGEKDSKKISQPSARMRFSSSQTAK